MADISNLASYPFVKLCQIDRLDSIKKIGDDPFVTSGDITEKWEGGKNTPLAVAG